MTLISTYSVLSKTEEFQANSLVTGNQLSPDVTGLSNGGFVLAYNNGDINGGQLAVDFYNPAHQRIGTFQVPDDGGSKAMGQPAVVELVNGNVLVTWYDNETGDAGRKGRIYTAEGEPISAEMNFNPGAAADGSNDDIQVTALTNGGFVTTFSAGGHIYHGQYTDSGTLVGGGFFQVNSAAAAATPVDSAVAALSNGGYVVTYTDTGPADQVIRARIYAADGTTVVDDKIIASNGDNTQAKVVGLDGGNWAVVYTDTGWGGADAGNSAITLEIFNAAGNSVSGFVRVNVASSQFESEPDITVLDNGFIAVSWTKEFTGGDFDIRGRIFTPAGVAVTDQFSITLTPDADLKSAIAGLMSGEFVTAWQDSGTDGDGGSITAEVNEIIRTTVGDGDADAFVGDALRDIVTAGGGTDTIDGGAGNDDLFGEGADDVLMGGAGTDLLDGGIGADIMQGGADNDIYIIDQAGDVVNEVNGSGTDTVRTSVSFSLADTMHVTGDVENATLLGTDNLSLLGNALDNVLIGNSGVNTLNGGVGADLMQGGAGNDVYTVDNAGDVADESVMGSNGLDTVRSSISFSLADAVHAKGAIENLILVGSANINGLGNAFDNVLTGNAGNNTLNGGVGADTLRGGAGNDIYAVDNIADLVDESVAGSSGVDTVLSVVTFNLVNAAQALGSIENVSLLGATNINAFGNALGNVLIGNNGMNTLAGGLGNDTLTGGAGNDVFLFNTAPNAMTNVDTITDMNASGNDTIKLDNAVFTMLADGALSIAEFKISSTGATQLDDRIIYNDVNGELTYDTNGLAAGGSTLIAILDPGLALTAADFVVA